MSKLSDLLSTGKVLLADGATGTNLITMGLDSGYPPELWNVEHPERIRALHRGFLDAGSDILVTNSFGGTRRRLHLHNLQDRVKELNARAAEIAAEESANEGRPIVIAGSVGPTGDLFVPLGPLTFEQAVDAFAEQIEGLKAGGADVAWIETMSAPEEIAAAAEAARQVGLPYTVTVSFDTAGRSMMGLSPAEFARTMREQVWAPEAIGSNCGVGASDLVFAMLDLIDNAGDLPAIAKANAGIPHVHGDGVVYSGTPDLMEDYTRLAIDAGARIVGGCCGNTAEHVARMRKAIDTHERGERPTLEEIVNRLGPLVSPPSTKTSNRGETRRRRRD
ncbi:MAG TPA: betaine--homocysteine S-methyltransferase [Devosiaceae bacterium]